MKRSIDWVLWRRGRALCRTIEAWVPAGSAIIDIGSGTGHNGALLRASDRAVEEFDVVDMHWVGPGPELFDGRRLQRPEDGCDAVLLAFVLQYAEDPAVLLREASRLARGKVLVVQSSFEGSLARVLLGVREHLWGPVALAVARGLGLVGDFESPLVTRRHYRRSDLRELFERCGLEEVYSESESWPGLAVRRDFFVLDPGASP